MNCLKMLYTLVYKYMTYHHVKNYCDITMPI